jgi:hypothetical protein
VIVACVRLLYGEDWIVPLVRSVLPHVDEVVIFWSDRPWGQARSVTYLGNDTAIPWTAGKPFDGWVDRVREQGFDPKPPVSQHYFHVDTPKGYWTAAINDRWPSKMPETLILLEGDHVWRDDQMRMALREFSNNRMKCATSRQIELWRTFDWRIPERSNRTGCVFWDTRGMSAFPPTRSQGEWSGTEMQTLRAEVHNLGFCSSERTMLSKHLTALSFSGKIGDSKPNARWLEDVWKRWTPGMGNLEISEGHEHSIRCAIPYDRTMIPEVLK